MPFFLPPFVVLARFEINFELMFEILSPLLQFASAVTLGTEPLLSVNQHLPEVLQFALELCRVICLPLELQAQLVEVRR